MTSTSDDKRQDFVKQPISFLLNKRQKKESDDTGPNPAEDEEEEDSSDDEPRRECDEYFEGDAMARQYYDSDSESDPTRAFISRSTLSSLFVIIILC